MAQPDVAEHSWLRNALFGRDVCVRHDEFDHEALLPLMTAPNRRRLAALGKNLPAAQSLVCDLFFLFFKGIIRFEDYDLLAPQAKYHRAMLEERVVGAPVFLDVRRMCFMNANASFEAALASAAGLSSAIDAEEMSVVEKIDQVDRALQDAMGTLKGVKGAKAASQYLQVQDRPHDQSEIPPDARILNQLRSPGNFSGQKRSGQEKQIEFGRHARNGANILPYHERVNMKEQLMALERFRRFLNLAFDMKNRSRAAVQNSLELEQEEIHTVASGSDLAMLLPVELASLTRQALRKGFLKRLIDGELVTYDMNRKRRRGPLIACIDTSHSMSGDNEIFSKALALALRDIARENERDFQAILFGGPGEQKILDFSSTRLEDLIDLAEFNYGAGTNFERPLLAAMQMQLDSGLDRGDIVFMTDGRCEIPLSAMDRILWGKKRRHVKITSLVMNLGRNTEASLRAPLSDKILYAGDFADAAELPAAGGDQKPAPPSGPLAPRG